MLWLPKGRNPKPRTWQRTRITHQKAGMLKEGGQVGTHNGAVILQEKRISEARRAPPEGPGSRGTRSRCLGETTRSQGAPQGDFEA